MGILPDGRIDRAYSGAAAAYLCDFNMFANTKAANAHANHQCFVPGERDHINIHFFHVDRDHASGLRRIDDEDDVVLPAKTPHFAKWLHRADDVGTVVNISAFVFGRMARLTSSGSMNPSE